eukprot:m.161516 g.161516  ORF g.161516 m.161516 type:complete len:112 (+) comp13402_c0_seq1:2574-2909(+)
MRVHVHPTESVFIFPSECRVAHSPFLIPENVRLRVTSSPKYQHHHNDQKQQKSDNNTHRHLKIISNQKFNYNNKHQFFEKRDKRKPTRKNTSTSYLENTQSTTHTSCTSIG